jgi:CBS domain-containing protein
MWWPAIGGLAVGAIGYFAPRTLGVGYENITEIVSGSLAVKAVLVLGGLKLVSWLIALGSGTSGGTLAPLFTIGGAAGFLLGIAAQTALPAAGLDARIAAVVGMAALFAGASRAFLASVLFAFETTHAAPALLPLLAGCGAAHLVSALRMPTSIMTEKIVRRGVRVPSDYTADYLEQRLAGEAATRPAVALRADELAAEVRAHLAARGPGARHQGFPVVDGEGRLAGVVMQREILDATEPGTRIADLVQRPAIAIAEHETLRAAADRMATHELGRLPVVARDGKLVGILTRSDLVAAHRARLAEHTRA